MNLENLRVLLTLISDKGWARIYEAAQKVLIKTFDTTILKNDYDSYQRVKQTTDAVIKKAVIKRPGRENPFDKNCFKEQSFDPFQGFFKPSTFRKVFIELYSDVRTIKVGNPPELTEVKSKLYTIPSTTDYKKKIAVASYLTAINLLHTPDYGKSPSVLPVMNGLATGVLPDLKQAAGNFGTDSFGVHWFMGNFDYIFLKEQIEEVVLTDFEFQTKKKIPIRIKKELALKDIKEEKILSEIVLMTIVLIHELGHRLDKRCLKNQQQELHYFWMKYKSTKEISKYGIQSSAEWLAETWAAWVIDGLSYNQDVKNDFLNILYPTIPTIKGKVEVLQKDKTLFTWETLKSFLVKNNMAVGTPFRLTITYDVGPIVEITGSLVSIIKSEIPTLKYQDEYGIKSLNFFPNRTVVNLEVEKLTEE